MKTSNKTMIKTIIYTFMNRIATTDTSHKCLFCCFRCAMLFITLSHKLSCVYYLLVWAYECSPQMAHPAVVVIQNHFFAHYSTTLLAKLYMTCFLVDMKFLQMDHVFAKFASAIFCLICNCACAETATVVLALILYKIKFSVPGFLHNLSFDGFLNHILATFSAHAHFRCKIQPQNWLLRARFTIWREILQIGPRFQVFLANFLLCVHRNGHKTTSGQILNPKFENSWAVFYSTTNFGALTIQDLCVFCAKNGFCNANF